MKNSRTSTDSEPNTKKKNWKDEIKDPDSCIKAIFISYDIRKLKQQVQDGDDPLETKNKIKEMAKECKELALKGYTNKRIANKYFTY